MKRLGISVMIFMILCSFFAHQNGVSVKFRNGTKQDFELLSVNIRGQKFSFKNIKAGEETQPITVAGTYGYCYAQAITLKDTLVCQPVDFVGETFYQKGKFTMTLHMIGEEKKYMAIKLTEQ